MNVVADKFEPLTAIHTDLGAIFVSLELSRSSWLITSLSPRGGEKMSKHSVRGGDFAGLMERFAKLQEKARLRTGQNFRIIVVQEAGLDGFWIHRALQNEGIESHVVGATSIATSRRRRRAKTDKIDGETLVRALLAYKRGEPRVCTMVKVPTPGEEDRRHPCRERKALTAERVRHVNRIIALLFSQGISGYQPLRSDRRQRLEELQTGDGRTFPPHLKALVNRELDRLELLLKQIKTVEAARDALLAVEQTAKPAPAAMLLDIRGIGPEFAAIPWSEGLFRHFENRRQIAAYAGLAPTPWQSGAVDREQGVSKAGTAFLATRRRSGARCSSRVLEADRLPMPDQSPARSRRCRPPLAECRSELHVFGRKSGVAVSPADVPGLAHRQNPGDVCGFDRTGLQRSALTPRAPTCRARSCTAAPFGIKHPSAADASGTDLAVDAASTLSPTVCASAICAVSRAKFVRSAA